MVLRSRLRLGFAAVAAGLAFSSCETPPSEAELGLGPVSLLREMDGTPAPLPPEVPTQFTGCFAESRACFMRGRRINAALRFEAQSGRYWFLDPNSGNTYYANGDKRTENAFDR